MSGWAARLQVVAPPQPRIPDVLDFPDMRRDFLHRRAAVLALADSRSVNAPDLAFIEPMPAQRAGELSEFHLDPRPPIFLVPLSRRA